MKRSSQPDPSVYLRNNYVVLDFEVEVKDGRYGHAADPRNSLALACWRRNVCLFSAWGDEYELAGPLKQLMAHNVLLVAHNAKYELGWLYRMGLDLHSITVWDTKIAEYVLLGNRASGDAKHGIPGVSTSLGDCRVRRGWKDKDAAVDQWMRAGVPISEMPRAWVEARCRSDVSSTEQLFKDQRAEAAALGLLPVIWSRCALTPVLVEMEARGMHLDSDRVDKLHAEYSARQQQLTEAMSRLTSGINWRSNKQAGEYIYSTLGFKELMRRGKPDRTAEGAPKTDQKTLEKLVATTQEQRSFLALRKEIGKVSALLSKNLDYFKGVVTHGKDGIFRAEFNQTRTATHRLSSNGSGQTYGSVQLQNVPRTFAGLFTARRRGWLMGSADSAQLEFRVAAYLGNDAQAKRDIGDPNFDAHIISAATMAGVAPADLLDKYRKGDKRAAELRQLAKAETFKPLYGGQRGTPAQERWYKEFRERYPGIAETQKSWAYTVLKDKQLRTITGLTFYWPHASINAQGYINVSPSVYNYPVQSLATAEIVPMAVTAFWRMVRTEELEEQINLVNTVHDSLVAEVAPEARWTFIRLAKSAFTTEVYVQLKAVYGIDFDVPLGVGIKLGEHLDDAKEQSFDIYPNGREVIRS